MADLIEAPWDDETVERLNAFQNRPNTHAFTCRNRNDGAHVELRPTADLGQLIATPAGWICADCDYTQGWAFAAMVGCSPSNRLP